MTLPTCIDTLPIREGRSCAVALQPSSSSGFGRRDR